MAEQLYPKHFCNNNLCLHSQTTLFIFFIHSKFFLGSLNDSTMAAAKLIESSKNNLNPEEVIDFESLPWLCQKRFAEICDGKTLKTFASIDASTRRLAKRCHVFDEVFVDATFVSQCTYKLRCYCDAGQDCPFHNQWIDPSFFKVKVLIANRIKIVDYCSEKTEASFFRNLPINFNFFEYLFIHVRRINLKDLQTITNPGLKSLYFMDSIESDVTL